jgi:hypothetical protein
MNTSLKSPPHAETRERIVAALLHPAVIVGGSATSSIFTT